MISLPSEAKIKEKEDSKAVFEVDALYPGYGTTIGNGLRRALLSSLEGAAVTQVKITDVQHEFSTIDGVMEDVINIILNLKQLNFKVFSDEPQKAKLSVKGEKKVTAKDFKFPTQVEIVNGDAPIATLTSKDAELEMEIQIEKGIGFVPSEELKEGKEEVGQITIDAIFSPVKMVNFNVENMRVGERTDFDRLTLELETDGSISPEDAFVTACKILIDHFSIMKDPFTEEELEEKKKKEEKDDEKEEEKEEEKSKKKEVDLEDLDLPSRVESAIKKENISAEELLEMTKEDLVNLDGVGEKSAEKVLKELKRI